MSTPEDPRSARALRFVAQDPASLRFTSSVPLYNFLCLMKAAGSLIHRADDPSVPSMGWVVRYLPDDDHDHILAEITLTDFRNSSDPQCAPSESQWDALCQIPAC